MYIGSAKTFDFCMCVCFVFMYALLSCLPTCMVSPDMKCNIVRTFENRIPFQTFEKWHNVSYRYVSYKKSEKSDIWRRGAWFLKPFGERVEENHIYPLVKPNFAVKTRTVYRRYDVCYQVFLENGRFDFKSKI